MKDDLLPVALGTAAVMAVIEVPLSQRFPLREPLSTTTRVAVAAGMGFAAVMLAGYALRATKRLP